MPALNDLAPEEFDVATIGSTPPAEASQADVPEAYTADKATAAQADVSTGTTGQATATGYEAVTDEIATDSNRLVSTRMNAITKQDSPIMKLAKQMGIQTAASRGLQNSSLAAGSAQREMVKAALPMAQQEAASFDKQAITNQAARNRSTEVSTGRETDIAALNAQLSSDMEKFNADAENQIATLNAQLETAVNQDNAQAANNIKMQLADLRTQVDMTNSQMQTQINENNANRQFQGAAMDAESRNALHQSVFTQQSELNKQFLAGEQALDLADISGRYNLLISTNEMAGRMFSTYMDVIGAAMANQKITPDRVAKYVQTLSKMLEGGLRMMDEMNNLDLSKYQTGTGTGSNFPSETGYVPPPGEVRTGRRG